jgi:hypothetical protein
MDHKRLEITGREGAIGHIELIPVTGDEVKVVIQLHKGFQVLAVRSEMSTGRISGILGRPPAPPGPAR